MKNLYIRKIAFLLVLTNGLTMSSARNTNTSNNLVVKNSPYVSIFDDDNDKNGNLIVSSWGNKYIFKGNVIYSTIKISVDYEKSNRKVKQYSYNLKKR